MNEGWGGLGLKPQVRPLEDTQSAFALMQSVFFGDGGGGCIETDHGFIEGWGGNGIATETI